MKHLLTVALFLTLAGCSHSPFGSRSPSSTGKPCGLQGSIEERIESCSGQDQRKEGFVLVARSGKYHEVYRDLRTGLLWSDRLPHGLNHFDARKACHDGLAEVVGLTGLEWRLPSKAEYQTADENGIRKALPGMDVWFWTGTIDTESKAMAYFFNGRNGRILPDSFYYAGTFVRCVAAQ